MYITDYKLVYTIQEKNSLWDLVSAIHIVFGKDIINLSVICRSAKTYKLTGILSFRFRKRKSEMTAALGKVFAKDGMKG